MSHIANHESVLINLHVKIQQVKFQDKNFDKNPVKI